MSCTARDRHRSGRYAARRDDAVAHGFARVSVGGEAARRHAAAHAHAATVGQVRQDAQPHVGVGEKDHLVVAHLLSVEIFAGAAADRGDERLDLFVLEQAVDASHVVGVESDALQSEDRATGIEHTDDDFFAVR